MAMTSRTLPSHPDFHGGGKKGTGTFNNFPRTTKLLAGGSTPNVCFSEGKHTEGCLLLLHSGDPGTLDSNTGA